MALGYINIKNGLFGTFAKFRISLVRNFAVCRRVSKVLQSVVIIILFGILTCSLKLYRYHPQIIMSVTIKMFKRSLSRYRGNQHLEGSVITIQRHSAC